MSDPEWEDVSSHRRGETDRTPKSWACRIGVFRLVVTRSVHYSPDKWISRCAGIFNDYELKSVGIEDAKDEAAAILVKHLTQAKDDCERLISSRYEG